MLLLVSKSALAPKGNLSVATRFLADRVGAPCHFTVSVPRMIGWKVQLYDNVSTLRTTYVHEPPDAMLRESKTQCEVALWGTRSLLRQTIRSAQYTVSAAGVERKQPGNTGGCQGSCRLK